MQQFVRGAPDCQPPLAEITHDLSLTTAQMSVAISPCRVDGARLYWSTLRNAPRNEPNPIIVRYVSRVNRERVLKVRKNLKVYNEDKNVKLYINEDLEAILAKLFSIARSLQKQRLLAQTWTCKGAIKVKTQEGVLHTVTTSSQLKL